MLEQRGITCTASRFSANNIIEEHDPSHIVCTDDADPIMKLGTAEIVVLPPANRAYRNGQRAAKAMFFGVPPLLCLYLFNALNVATAVLAVALAAGLSHLYERQPR